MGAGADAARMALAAKGVDRWPTTDWSVQRATWPARRAPFAIIAQAILASLLASAIAATVAGRRSSSLVSQGRCLLLRPLPPARSRPRNHAPSERWRPAPWRAWGRRLGWRRAAYTLRSCDAVTSRPAGGRGCGSDGAAHRAGWRAHTGTCERDQGYKFIDAIATERGDDTELGQMGADRVDHRRLLTHEEVSRRCRTRPACWSGVLIVTKRMLGRCTARSPQHRRRRYSHRFT